MTTLSTFNDMMEHFVDELVQTFPAVPSFKKYQMVVQMARKTNPRKIMTTFMESVSPHASKIMSKDETIWANEALTIDFLNELQINKIWTPELSNNTKDAIWQYLQTLYIIGSTISMLPEETLTAIEDMAKKMSDDPESLSKLLGSNSNLMESLLGKNTIHK
jgi:hypothetical protein